MTTKIQYSDQTSRQKVVDANKDKYLVLEENLITGNFLTFEDEKPLENQLAELNENQLSLMDAITDVYMAMP